MSRKCAIMVAALFAAFSTGPPPAGAGNALRFDGNDFVLIPDSTSLNFPPGSSPTIEFWLWLNVIQTGEYHVLGKRDGCLQSERHYQIAHDGNLFFHGGLNGCTVQFTDGVDGDPDPNVWHHFAFVFFGDSCQLYWNGVYLATEATTPGLAEATDAGLKIGTSGTCLGVGGLVDEVRIWNMARSADEIAANYARCVDPVSPGLVGYWTFDEPDSTDQTVCDASPFGNNGTLGEDGSIEPSVDPVRVVSTAPIDDGLCPGCRTTATSATTWGRIKTLFR